MCIYHNKPPRFQAYGTVRVACVLNLKKKNTLRADSNFTLKQIEKFCSNKLMADIEMNCESQ